MQEFVIVGASGGIGQALAEYILENNERARLTAFTTNPERLRLDHPRLRVFAYEANSQGVEQAIAPLKQEFAQLRAAYICTGLLHNETIQPEKRLEQFSLSTFTEVMSINAALPLIWLQALLPFLKKSEHAVFAAISARVGSISDNQLGGWYSYRASKAALNMLMKTAAIECARRAPQLKLLCFHPGTTDTALSKPFQANVPEHKLFTPAFVAERFYQLSMKLNADGELSFIDWDDQPIAW